MAEVRLVEAVLAEAGRVRRGLSLEEVIEAGVPAVYQRYGDQLLFMDGRIFDARDPKELAETTLIVAGAGVQSIGVEFGWRHVGDCPCPFCSERPAEGAA
jgi:hypothetical protein